MLTNSDVFSDQSERESEKQTQTQFRSQQRSEAIRKWIMCIQCRRRSVLDHPRRGSFHPRMSPVSLLMCHSSNTLKHELTALHNRTCKKGENLSGLFQWSNIHLKTAPPLWTRLSGASIPTSTTAKKCNLQDSSWGRRAARCTKKLLFSQ